VCGETRKGNSDKRRFAGILRHLDEINHIYRTRIPYKFPITRESPRQGLEYDWLNGMLLSEEHADISNSAIDIELKTKGIKGILKDDVSSYGNGI